MDEQSVSRDQAELDAVEWFGEQLAPGEWVNTTWIGRRGEAEMRLLDLASGNGHHRLLLRIRPTDDSASSWDGLEYEELRQTIDQIRKKSESSGFILWEFAGPASTIPGYDELMALEASADESASPVEQR